VRGFRRMAALVGVVALALAAGCGGEGSGSGAKEGGGGRLSIATGGTSGVYFVYGGGLAKVISSKLKGYRATAETTSASVDNLILIDKGSSDIAFTLGDTALDAVKGREGFKAPVPMRALAQIYDNYTQVVAKAGSGIKSIEDLKGKRVSVGAPNSGTEIIADRIFAAAGIDSKSGIKRQGLGVEESVQAMKDGSIDAFFWSGGLPTGAVTDLTTTDKITLLDTTVYTDKLAEKYGEVYRDETIPKGTYKGVTKDVPTIAVPNYLVVSETMDDKLAHDLTKLLFDQKQDLVAVHPEAKNLDPARAAKVIAPIELHPGAKRYFDEAGA
jgi:TRAP transporter TAXI family solute receptor